MINEVEQYKKTLHEHFEIDDWQAVDIVLSVVVAHKIKGNMLWLRIIGAGGTGKTEILRSLLSNKEFCAPCETFTQAAIRGGLKKEGQDAPRLLKRLDKKLAITKEFNTILTKSKEDKEGIFGLLRSVHDGELVSDFGSEAGFIEQKVWFDWILGVTQYVDRQRLLDALLGTRFLDLRWGRPINHRSLVAFALSNDEKLDAIRTEVSEKMNNIIYAVTPDTRRPNIDLIWLADLANLVCIARTPVDRDSYAKDKGIISMPDPEAPTRMAQMMARVIKGLYLLGETNYKPYIARLAMDNIPTLRAAYIKAKLEGAHEGKTIASVLGISEATASHLKEDLNILKLNIIQLGDLLKVTQYII